jgi:AraC-like DNA-binding protein
VSISALSVALERLAPPNGGPAAVAARARHHVDENFAKPLRTAELAGQLGVSERHLRRLFQATFGMTLQRYLTETRIRRAGYLLRTTAWGLKAIAEGVGFRSHSRFGKAFRSLQGVTPSEYREGRHGPGKESDPSPPRT